MRQHLAFVLLLFTSSLQSRSDKNLIDVSFRIEVPNVKEMLEEINADYGLACQRALME